MSSERSRTDLVRKDCKSEGDTPRQIKADPSTRAEALGRDDKGKGSAGRGAKAPLYPNDNAQDDSNRGRAAFRPRLVMA